MGAERPGPPTVTTAARSFIRRFRAEILAAWQAAARAIPAAKELTSVVLVDHMPELLDQMAELADDVAAGRPCDARLATGEGFAGAIAAERKPRSVRAAYLDSQVRNRVLRDQRIHALYGIPLIQGDELIGVATMGSLTADEFSDEDRQFFGSMASRATIGIRHLVLRDQLAEIASERERALAKLESLLAASPVATGFVDRDLRYLRVNEALAALNGT